jgi:hypothetical protein
VHHLNRPAQDGQPVIKRVTGRVETHRIDTGITPHPQRKAADFYDGKRLAAQYLFHCESAKTTVQFDLLENWL